MKNNNNNFENEVIKTNELESVSGGTGKSENYIFYIDQELCDGDGCGQCKEMCPNNAIVEDGDKYKIIPDRCGDCEICFDFCTAIDNR